MKFQIRHPWKCFAPSQSGRGQAWDHSSCPALAAPLHIAQRGLPPRDPSHFVLAASTSLISLPTLSSSSPIIPQQRAIARQALHRDRRHRAPILSHDRRLPCRRREFGVPTSPFPSSLLGLVPLSLVSFLHRLFRGSSTGQVLNIPLSNPFFLLSSFASFIVEVRDLGSVRSSRITPTACPLSVPG